MGNRHAKIQPNPISIVTIALKLSNRGPPLPSTKIQASVLYISASHTRGCTIDFNRLRSTLCARAQCLLMAAAARFVAFLQVMPRHIGSHGRTASTVVKSALTDVRGASICRTVLFIVLSVPTGKVPCSRIRRSGPPFRIQIQDGGGGYNKGSSPSTIQTSFDEHPTYSQI
jgi:hypothetical protein